MPGPTLSSGRSWFKYFQYEEGRDSPGDARNVLLVVVTLIAAVTFQAGLSPPGGVWQDDRDDEHGRAGKAIFACRIKAYYVFLISNTLALSTSIHVIVSLTYKFPFHFEIWVAAASMMVTYASAVFAVTPDKSFSLRYIVLTAALPSVIRCLIHLFNKCASKISRARSSITIHSDLSDKCSQPIC